MANIFNKPTKTNSGGFSIDSAQLTFTALGPTGLLVQNLQIQYQQQVSFLYDLTNPNNVYYVAGRAEGNMNIGKVVGSGGLVKTFYKTYGDVCGASTAGASSNTINLSFDTNCASATGSTSSGSARVRIINPIILSFGLQMQVDQGIISENVALRFSDLELD